MPGFKIEVSEENPDLTFMGGATFSNGGWLLQVSIRLMRLQAGNLYKIDGSCAILPLFSEYSGLTVDL